MFISELREPLFSFPSLPGSITAGHSISDLALRRFGILESDLAIDFNQKRPFLVTDILESCTREGPGRKVETEFFWRLPVGKRIECLLALAYLETGTEIPVAFRCPNRNCGLELEVEISIEEIAAQQKEAYQTELVTVGIENAELSLRRPTASDQREWLKSSFTDEPSAVKAMVRTLLLDEAGQEAIESPSSSELIEVLEQAMELHDPLVNFAVAAKCSSCGIENSLEIDLEELSLRHLWRAQSRLLTSVHILAAKYHWSEPQIFAVPSWRRARYLSLIEKEKEQ